MVDTGFTDGMAEDGMQRFARVIAPTRMRALARVDALAQSFLQSDMTFDELEAGFLARVRDALDGTGNYGMKSYGMKSYLLPRVGLITPSTIARWRRPHGRASSNRARIRRPTAQRQG